MISKNEIESSSAAGHYFEQAWSARESSVDYYTQERVPSAWSGAGAIHAGFEPGAAVEREDFLKVLDGHLTSPTTGEEQSLGKFGKDGKWEHRCGWDYTFAPPKSVSMIGTLGDERIRAIHETAVERAMQYLEKHAAQTRVREGGEVTTIDTGNLLYAKFSHETNRDDDMQIHTHVVIANATYDKAAGQWRSLKNDNLLELRRAADSVYLNTIAYELRHVGYQVDWNKAGTSFEIAGITRDQIKEFSRTTEIEAWLRDHGIDPSTADHEQRQVATLATRPYKSDASRDEILANWQERAAALGIDAEKIVAQAHENERRRDPQQEAATAEYAVRIAVKHVSENEAAFGRKDLDMACMNFAQGKTTINAVELAQARALADGKLIQRSDGMFTTPAAIKREQEMLQTLERGRERLAPIADSRTIDMRLDALDQQRGFRLNEGQRDASRMVLSTRDQFSAIQGYAGTGKTTLFEAVRKAAEADNVTVRGMSAGAKQAATLENETGIKSQTLASFLIEQRKLNADGAQITDRSAGEHHRMTTILGNKYVDLGVGQGVVVARSGLLNAGPMAAAQSDNTFVAAVGRHFTEWEKCGFAEAQAARAAMALDTLRGYAQDTRTLDAAACRGTRELWVLDEASQASQKDLAELMRHAEARGAQLVLSGDTAQHQSVEAGKAYEQLQGAGIATAELTDIRRQKDETGKAAVRDVLNDYSETRAGDSIVVKKVERPDGEMRPEDHGPRRPEVVDAVNERTGDAYRLAVAGQEVRDRLTVRDAAPDLLVVADKRGQEHALTGGAQAAYDRLEKIEVASNRELITLQAKNYVASPDWDRTLIVTATNADRQQINVAVREELKTNGVIDPRTERQAESLIKSDMSRAERKEARRYEAGDVLRANRDYTRSDGPARGEYLRIESIDEKRNLLVCRSQTTGQTHAINPAEKTQFSAFRSEQTAFAVGDRVRFTLNEHGAGIRNGEIGTVRALSDKQMTVAVGAGKQAREINIDTTKYRHIEHGYAGTTYGLQGVTEFRVSYHINTASAGGIGERAFYVGVTRAREGTTVYTTDLAKARDLVARAQGKTSALELKANPAHSKSHSLAAGKSDGTDKRQGQHQAKGPKTGTDHGKSATDAKRERMRQSEAPRREEQRSVGMRR